MIRNLRDIVYIAAAVLLAGIAICNSTGPDSKIIDIQLEALLEELHQDSFEAGSSSPENFMESNISTLIVLSTGCDSPRCQTSMKASSSTTSVSSYIQTTASFSDERHFSISRLTDYYVFGLGHIIV